MQIQSSNIYNLSANSITTSTLTAGGGSSIGDVTFNYHPKLKATAIDRATNPSSKLYKYFDFVDKNDLRLGVIGAFMGANGYYGTYLQGGNECGITVASNGTTTECSTSANIFRCNSLIATQLAGPLVVTGGDAATGVGNIQLDTNGQITAKGTTATLFGRSDGTNLYLGHGSYKLIVRGSETNLKYNNYSIPHIIETNSGSDHSSGGLAHKWTYMVTQTPLGKLYEEWGFSDYLTYNDNTNYYLYFQKTLKSYSDGTATITHGQYGASDCAAFDCTFDTTARAAIRQHRYSNSSDSYRFTYYVRGLIN